MKKQILAAALVAMLGLTACGESEKSDNKTENTTEATTAAETTEAAATEEITPEAATVAVPTELSDKYADLDNRSFKYDGHLYTVGVSTLQDFLDNGVEFESSDNWDKMWDEEFSGQTQYRSFECEIKVRGWNQFKLYFFKTTDHAIPMRECVLGEVDATILNYEVGSEAYSQAEFAFPWAMTPDELVANSGEPTYKDGNGMGQDYFYTVVSDKFNTEDSGYQFMFDKDEELWGVEMTWIP